MNRINYKKYFTILIALFSLSLTSCNKFLDIEPESQITPEQYFSDESHLLSYVINFYDWFPAHPIDGGGGYGFYAGDNNTDNQATSDVPSRFLKNFWKVPASGTTWSFDKIYKVNYLLDNALPKWKEGKISGNKTAVNNLIGEAYFFRAYAYNEMLVKFGDFPIIKHTLPDEMSVLLENTKRSPRNEVARFILSDLDSAAMFLSSTSIDGRNNRINKYVADLFKSRVALFEASWLKNFNNTPFVPNGPEWPGKSKELTANYEYPSGSIENEINFFLDEAMKSSQTVSDKYMPVMAVNTQVVPSPANEDNPYYWMFCDVDMSKYPEIMLWKEYVGPLRITNAVNEAASTTSAALTRGMVKQFLDKDGMPWYASSIWTDDTEMYNVREGRDSRASLFIKEPGQDLMWKNLTTGTTYGLNVEPWVDEKYFHITGYSSRKALNPDRLLNQLQLGLTGSPIFRSAEALLNYIEASYMREGSINAKAREYWEYLRQRAGIKANSIDETIAAIDMTKEALYDWGAYSAGKLVDATTMAIRKERRSEYMCESRRMDDLIRWRALDQLIDNPYHIEGMRLWNSDYYNNKLNDAERAIFIVSSGDSEKANVSSPDDNVGTGDINGDNKGDYLKIHRLNTSLSGYNGTTWQLAHYLSPIEIEHFLISSPDFKDANNSSLYQNPYWPLKANAFAEK